MNPRRNARSHYSKWDYARGKVGTIDTIQETVAVNKLVCRYNCYWRSRQTVERAGFMKN
jgi:hypothetical protein